MLEISELGKPAHKLCEHYNNGCSIYSDRPEACRKFECGWLQGLMPEELPPNKTHLLLEVFDDIILATSQFPGAGKEYLAELEELISQGYTVVISDGNTKLMKGPEGRDLLEASLKLKKFASDMGVI